MVSYIRFLEINFAITNRKQIIKFIISVLSYWWVTNHRCWSDGQVHMSYTLLGLNLFGKLIIFDNYFIFDETLSLQTPKSGA